MARPAPHAPAADQFTEKEFYLDEFRGHTLVLAAHAAQLDSEAAFEALSAVLRDLLPNDTRVIVLVDAGGSTSAESAMRLLHRRLDPLVFRDQTMPLFPHLRTRRGRADAFVVLDPSSDGAALETVAAIWSVLRRTPVFVGVVRCTASELAEYAQRLAARLRAYKLILVEDEGGVTDASGSQLSFMDAAMLGALLSRGEAEWTGVAHRRPTLEAIERALRAGVPAVNLCRLDGLGRELFTYEGSGTLFTLEDYCRVAPLGIDDFEEAERLIERGQREGFLKTRSAEEIAQIALRSYGATIGAQHLAGICALYAEPYAAEAAGEIVALYTMTRFKNESVGRRLLASVEEEAGRRGLGYLFAVTTEARAQAFFERYGFARVTPADVPPAKWDGYDPGRLERVAVYRLDLKPAEAGKQ